MTVHNGVWMRLRSRCYVSRARRSVSVGFLAPYFYYLQGNRTCGFVCYFRLWSNGPGLHIRRRPSFLLFSERHGLTPIHTWGAFVWKVLK